MTFVIENHLWMAVIDTPQAYEHKHFKGCRVEIFNHVRYAGNDEKTKFFARDFVKQLTDFYLIYLHSQTIVFFVNCHFNRAFENC